MKNPKKGATKRIAYGGLVMLFVLAIAALAASNFYTDDSQSAATKIGAERTTSCPPYCGRIVIIKDAVPDNSEDFSFTHNVPGSISPFILDDDGVQNNPLSNTTTLITPYNGTFTITEVSTSGYAVSISCNDQTMDTMINGLSANVSITNGETVTCTFTNKKKMASAPSGEVPVVSDNGKEITSDSNAVPSVQSCVSDTWTQRESLVAYVGGFNVSPRMQAVGLSINNKGYIGMGATYLNGVYPSDFREYNPATDTWAQRANFIGSRLNSVGFSIEDKGYVGTGYSNSIFYNDFWEFDPETNYWTQKLDFPGAPRTKAVGFSVNGKGYIGTGDPSGSTETLADFWEYDPLANSWIAIDDFGGGGRESAFSFSIGNKGYVGAGRGSNNSLSTDLWEYNPLTDEWTEKVGLFGDALESAVGFSIGNKGYVGTGAVYSPDYEYTADFWEYDPMSMVNGVDNNGDPLGDWIGKAPFGGGVRSSAVGFSIGNRGYIGFGVAAPGQYTIANNDLWEYCP